MGLETATYISGLAASNPLSTDPKNQGDDHLRLIKSTILATFPNITGAVSASHTELGYVAGVTSAIQTQISGKASTTTPTITGLRETKAALGSNSIDLATGTYFSKTISTNTTFTLSNVPATGTAISFILDLTNAGAYTITWWSGVKWDSGSAPTLTASGRDILAFFTHDGGTTWNGIFVGKNMA